MDVVVGSSRPGLTLTPTLTLTLTLTLTPTLILTLTPILTLALTLTPTLTLTLTPTLTRYNEMMRQRLEAEDALAAQLKASEAKRKEEAKVRTCIVRVARA